MSPAATPTSSSPTAPSPITPRWRTIARGGGPDPGNAAVLLSALLWDDKTRTSPPGLILLGKRDKFWTSRNGVDWTAAPADYNRGLEYRQSFCAAAKLASVQLFGGDTRETTMADLWTFECGTPEPDGPKPSLTWKETPAGGIPARYSANMVTTQVLGDDPVRYGDCHGDFILGGADPRSQHYQDTWRSSFLQPAWTLVPAVNVYEGVENAGMIAWRGCLWRFGGAQYETLRPIREVYASGDNGATWWRPFAEVPWSPRSSPAVVALGDCLVLVGGRDAHQRTLEDCWIFDGSYWTPGPTPPYAGELCSDVMGCTEAPAWRAPARQRAWFMSPNTGASAVLEL